METVVGVTPTALAISFIVIYFTPSFIYIYDSNSTAKRYICQAICLPLNQEYLKNLDVYY
ncbi:hypothetical protein AN2V17_02660 [Vallitalea sp. AN17-2]|uniref:Uncharacterized protein n=1 Tax=Vallitalea maricola TaxID=3074433 RepID=A0ACB5UEP6_9FIRM|nr:hypothetical protein AN2V17_02660 [Vallitalea sp. AN17-2]